MDTPIDFYRHFSWLKKVNICSPSSNETYQDRLLRLEGDKESLVLQVSVLTDQVEAQGEKIRDLESSLEEHRQKLTSTEDMLQQELMSRTSLETQKLDLMDEVSYLKLKLVSMDENTVNGTTTPTPEPGDAKNNKAECVVNLISELQEQMCRFQEEISCRIQEKRALEEREAGQSLPYRGHSQSFSEPRTSQHSGANSVHVGRLHGSPPVPSPTSSPLTVHSSRYRTSTNHTNPCLYSTPVSVQGGGS